MDGFVRQQGEGKGLLGIAGHSQRVGGDDFDLRQCGRKLRHDQRIARAAARDDQLLDARSRPDPAIDGVDDRKRRQYGRRANQIVRTRAMAASPIEDALQTDFAVLLAARRLRRRPAGSTDRRAAYRAAPGSKRPRWAIFASRSKCRRPCVKWRTSPSITMLPGPVSKAKTSFGLRGAGNHGELAMPPMLSAARPISRIAIEQIVHQGNQRRALAADGHVRRAKIGHGGDAGERGDHGRLADLQRGSDARAEKVARRALVIDGLAVRADQARCAAG